jgi:CheY-like chemotaxis protein
MSDPRNSPGTASSEPSSRVLLAEDDRELRSLLSLLLSDDGYQVTAVSSGRELFDRVAEELGAGTRSFDAIVSDVRMPGMSAFDVLTQLRGITARVPVVLITAFADQATQRRAERLGVAAVLDKPFDLDDLRETLRELFSKPWRGNGARQCATLGSSGGPSGSADVPEPSAFP